MDKKELKEKIIKAIEENKDKIITVGRKIYANPEYGYKEFETAKTIVEYFKNELNLQVEEKLAYTGCRVRINEDKDGPKVAIFGEMDGITSPEHPDANEIGATHTCGHNVQIAGMLGVATGLIKSGVFKELDGKIDFIATPAEEFIELAYRSQLRANGHIKYFGGKQELIRIGALDDVNMSIMFHVMDTGDKKVLVALESNGFVGKEIKFIGKETHAGSAPSEGINALNAAMLAINNVNAQRETFKEADRVRFHPIITKGGDIVNVVPADVRMESYVRARTIESILDANQKVNRALIAGAMAVGAQIEITEIPGYLPVLKHENMEKVLRDNLYFLGFADDDIIDGGDFSGSFDFGDVSHIIPTLHPMFGGVKGALHTREYSIVDEEYAYLAPAKAMALTVVDLLYDNATIGKKILENFTPTMTKEEYLKYMESNDKVIKA
jgi:amidohydrolase